MTLTVAADPVPLRAEADGTLRVGETRVTLDIIIAAFRQGMSPEELVQQLMFWISQMFTLSSRFICGTRQK